MKLQVEIPYRDVDAMGHLNNVAYLAYLEWARQKYWLAMRGSSNFWDIDFVVVRAEIDYRAADGRVVAEAKTTQVCYDWKSRRKAPLSDERRRQIEGFEARPQ